MGGDAALKLENVSVAQHPEAYPTHLSVPLRTGMRAFGGRMALIIVPVASNW
jgi:hypothetical protein